MLPPVSTHRIAQAGSSRAVISDRRPPSFLRYCSVAKWTASPSPASSPPHGRRANSTKWHLETPLLPVRPGCTPPHTPITCCRTWRWHYSRGCTRGRTRCAGAKWKLVVKPRLPPFWLWPAGRTRNSTGRRVRPRHTSTRCTTSLVAKWACGDLCDFGTQRGELLERSGRHSKVVGRGSELPEVGYYRVDHCTRIWPGSHVGYGYARVKAPVIRTASWAKSELMKWLRDGGVSDLTAQ